MDEMGLEGLKSRKSSIWGQNDIVLVSITKKKSPRTSLSSPTSEKMEKNKKRKGKKKNMKMLEARCLS